MSRLSFRPRPVDIHKRLPILKSLKDFEDDENPSSTRNSQTFRYDVEAVNEVPQTPTKKLISEIPTPQYVDVDTYDRDYSRTFTQPTSYIHARGARAELGDFVEYDLDNEDEDWLEDFNRERTILTAEKFETILFKLEVLDHKVRERAGVITPPTLGSPIPVVLSFDAAIEALQSFSVMYGVFQSIYSYWKRKRQQTQKPVLRRLQPPPPVSDTNPFNVFRPREKAHRLHTRRMQRRENNIQSFEKLRLVRRNLEQSKTMLGALIKREEKKRELIESEVNLQRSHIIYKNESELLLEDSLGTPGMRSFYNKVVVSSDDEYVDSDDVANSRGSHQPLTESKAVVTPRREIRWRQAPRGWVHKLDPNEPVLMFTKPLDEEKLSRAGIKSPLNGPIKLHGRMGRGGRIVFDRWNPLMHTPIDYIQP